MPLDRRLIALLAAPMALTLAPAPVQAQDKEEVRVTDKDDHGEVDRIEMVAEDDPVMNAAIAEARETLPQWLAVLENPPAGVDYVVFKFPLSGWEHIWVDNVTRNGDMLTGTLANHPMQDDWEFGDSVTVSLSEVSDWGYWTGDVATGYRTMAVIIDRVSPAEAAQLRRQLGWAE